VDGKQSQDEIKRGDGSVQASPRSRTPTRGEDVPRRVELPPRATHRHGRRPRPFIDQSHVTQPLPASRLSGSSHRCTCTHGEAGLKHHVLPRSRTGTQDSPGHRRRGHAGASRGRGQRRCRLLEEKPRDVRSCQGPLQHHGRRGSGARAYLMDSGMDLSLRPMRYPAFLPPVPGMPQEQVDGTRRWTCTPTWRSFEANAGGAEPRFPAGRIFSPLATRSCPQSRAEPCTSKVNSPEAGLPVPASCSRKPCTCSSTGRCARYVRARRG